MTQYALLLASGSPRRKELLARLGVPFTVVVSGFDEDSVSTHNITPAQWTMRLAEGKARAARWTESKPFVVLGADTTVTLDGAYFNKPADEADARRMLSQLSGHTHTVTTGLCVWDTVTGTAQTAYRETDVAFRTLSSSEIDAYVATGEPMDKAGGYGIQGAARQFVSALQDADTDNVMGLPLGDVRRLLSPFFAGL